jgi:hypothetical protein
MAMRRESDPATPMLDYAPRRRRAPFEWGAAVGATIVLIFLNVLPHFRTTLGPQWSDAMEPEYGWPWIFYWSGSTYSGNGPFFEFKRLCLDLLLALALIAGYAVWRTHRASRQT